MKVARWDGPMLTSRWQTRASAPRAMTMSFSALWTEPGPRPAGRIRPSRTIRSSTVYWPAASFASTASSSFDSAFERNSTLPRLIPRIGTSTALPPPAAGVLPRGQLPTPPLELVRLGLRVEPDRAEVDSEDRHVDRDHAAGGPQERPVPTQHDEDVRREQLPAE